MRKISSNDVIYDSNIIIYYSFHTENHKILELTNKSKKLTEFLISNGSHIHVPKFIMDEIESKGIRKIIDEYITTNQITNLPQNPNMIFRLGLEFKIKRKLKRLQDKEWFSIEDYTPSEELINRIDDFFLNLNKSEITEFLKLKNRNNPKPSYNDIQLIAYSKEREHPLISNDYDITYFSKELIEKNLAHQIFNLKELIIYN